MKATVLVFVWVLLTGISHAGYSGDEREVQPESGYLGYIEVFDERLHQVLDTSAVPEIIGDGFQWAEGPVWVEELGGLLFSDVPENRIYQWTEEEGISVYLEPSGYTGHSGRGGELGSNGLIIGSEGELLLCQHGDRRIARMEAPVGRPAPEFATMGEKYNGKRFNSPNDLVQHSSGDIYFTDPPYGLEEYVDDPKKELDYSGVYRIDNGGRVHLLTDELTRPNGLAFSPDEQLLYVANSDPRSALWMVYDVLENGDIANGRVFYDVTDSVGSEPGLPDGMKVTREGNIFATGPGGVWVFSPDGVALGMIKTGEFVSNCALDEGQRILYMTADSYLLRLAL
ncbi:SMP-30/gluconolactonase/LRE family protein [Balneolales bacterium ANBcel1]|nr:SMP-30/gluconolactonase/LRE family protein [Balneolales bacterium ANBcel1]